MARKKVGDAMGAYGRLRKERPLSDDDYAADRALKDLHDAAFAMRRAVGAAVAADVLEFTAMVIRKPVPTREFSKLQRLALNIRDKGRPPGPRNYLRARADAARWLAASRDGQAPTAIARTEMTLLRRGQPRPTEEAMLKRVKRGIAQAKKWEALDILLGAVAPEGQKTGN